MHGVETPPPQPDVVDTPAKQPNPDASIPSCPKPSGAGGLGVGVDTSADVALSAASAELQL